METKTLPGKSNETTKYNAPSSAASGRTDFERYAENDTAVSGLVVYDAKPWASFNWRSNPGFRAAFGTRKELGRAAKTCKEVV